MSRYSKTLCYMIVEVFQRSRTIEMGVDGGTATSFTNVWLDGSLSEGWVGHPSTMVEVHSGTRAHWRHSYVPDI